MTLSIKHAFNSAVADSGNTALVQPSNWNAEHNITLAAGKVMGRDTSGAGAVQELPIAVDTSGNVGIGTTAGTTTVSSGLAINNATAANYPGLEIQTAGVTRMYFNANNAASYITSVGTNPLAIYTNSVERARIDSSGNVGIGTSSPGALLHVSNGSAAVRIGLTASSAYTDISRDGTSGYTIYNAAQATPYRGHIWQLGGTEVMRIDTSGNVGIGANVPATKLNVYTPSATNTFLRINNSVATLDIGVLSSGEAYGGIAAGTMYFGTSNASPTIFVATNSERMRLLSDGRFLVNTGTNLPNGTSGRFQVAYTKSAEWAMVIRPLDNNTGGGGPLLMSNLAGDAIGYITANASTVYYGSASDYRLKENIAPLTGGLTTVNALKPVTYDWKIDGAKGEGFIAHELQAVVPGAVHGEKDAVDKNGAIKPQALDYGRISVHLVAAIQELSSKNDALEARLTALESK